MPARTGSSLDRDTATEILFPTLLCSSLEPASLPVYADYDTRYYGFPLHGPGIKVADDTRGIGTDPDQIDRTIDHQEGERLGNWLAGLLPQQTFTLLSGSTCMYTETPDQDFLIGRHPRQPNVLVGQGFGTRIQVLDTNRTHAGTTGQHRIDALSGAAISAQSIRFLNDNVSTPFPLECSLETFLIVLVHNLFLVLKQPVNVGLVVHRFVDRECRGFTVDFKERFVVQVLVRRRTPD